MRARLAMLFAAAVLAVRPRSIAGIRRVSRGWFLILPRDDPPEVSGGQSDRQDYPHRSHDPITRCQTEVRRAGHVGRQLRRKRCTRIG